MYLLDTHAMLWYLRDSPELSASAHALIDNAEYVAVSIASFWESSTAFCWVKTLPLGDIYIVCGLQPNSSQTAL